MSHRSPGSAARFSTATSTLPFASSSTGTRIALVAAIVAAVGTQASSGGVARAQARAVQGGPPPSPAHGPIVKAPKKTLVRPRTGAPVLGAMAAPATASVPPRAVPELEDLRFLNGKWHCDGKQFASSWAGPEHVFKATAENKPTVNGAWNQFLYEELASKEHVGVKVHALWGWEAASRHLVRASVSSDGTWDLATSPGLEGDRVVWNGSFSTSQGRMAFRHTFIKRSDKEWTHALELRDLAGKWIAASEVSCKR